MRLRCLASLLAAILLLAAPNPGGAAPISGAVTITASAFVLPVIADPAEISFTFAFDTGVTFVDSATAVTLVASNIGASVLLATYLDGSDLLVISGDPDLLIAISGLTTVPVLEAMALGGVTPGISSPPTAVFFAASVPEPATLALFGAGLLGLAAARARRGRAV